MGSKRGYRPQMRKKELDFTGTEYEGLEVTVNLSLPYGMLEDCKKGDPDQILDVITFMLLDWNLCDIRTGEPLGKPTKETVRKAPQDILMAIFSKAMDQVDAGGVSKNVELSSGNS